MSGFDAAIEFQPHIKPAEKISTLKDEISIKNIQRSIAFRSRQFFNDQARELGIKRDPASEGMIIPYKDQVEYALKRSG